ncbi:hypothetical protein HMPREF1229_0098 [Streptococcus pyogenes GA40634]|nr:hypothetical protein HMPREF1229_0098 [Streptococcus pyogenes GA40634]
MTRIVVIFVRISYLINFQVSTILVVFLKKNNFVVKYDKTLNRKA